MIKESINTVGRPAVWFEYLKPNQVNLLMFICNHCPYVKYRMSAISKLVKEYKDLINIVAINSNDSSPDTEDSHIEDSPEYMPLFKTQYDLDCEYIFDHDQSIAKAYDIQCTPEFLIINNQGIIVYHGELDPSRKSNSLPPSGSSLRHALDLTLLDKPIDWIQSPSFGCSIKWKKI